MPASQQPEMIDARESDDTRNARLAALDLEGLTPEQLAEHIEEIPAADAAAFISRLDIADAAKVMEALDPTTAGKFLEQIDDRHVAAIVTAMNAPEASVVLAGIDPDDRVDILGYITGRFTMSCSAK